MALVLMNVTQSQSYSKPLFGSFTLIVTQSNIYVGTVY